jgi:asparagine synthase (glutamine-hydrolysing)
MCGIIFAIGDVIINNINNRGPDATIWGSDNTARWAFHRLIVRGKSETKFIERGPWLLLCNGEIYTDLYQVNDEVESDCEFILLEFLANGIEGVKNLVKNSEFAFVLYNRDTKQLITMRDRFGIRPLFRIFTKTGGVAYSSEVKYIPTETISHVEQVECVEYADTLSMRKKQMLRSYPGTNKSHLLYHALESAIADRLHPNMAFLLSGGLDSSIICAIATKLLQNQGSDARSMQTQSSAVGVIQTPIARSMQTQSSAVGTIQTFSIGTHPNATDLVAARIVAKFIGSNHHEIIVSNEEFINHIDQTIYFEETNDVTTIRAGIGMNIIAKKIKELGFTVVMTGEGSDELFGSYRYFLNAPSASDHVEETHRLLRDLKYFDVLRCDRTISNNSLEARVPFLDSRVVDCVHETFSDNDYLPKHGLMKFILRDVARSYNLLPEEIYNRPKEAFSDGVNCEGTSWWHLIDESCYEDIYKKYYGNLNLIPYKWLPRWCGAVDDPSAKVLDLYEKFENVKLD